MGPPAKPNSDFLPRQNDVARIQKPAAPEAATAEKFNYSNKKINYLFLETFKSARERLNQDKTTEISLFARLASFEI